MTKRPATIATEIDGIYIEYLSIIFYLLEAVYRSYLRYDE